MLYVESRKNFEGRREKNSLGFAESQQKNTRQNDYFAECHNETLGK